jgi:adenosylcobinamide kinase/adenosylcobinamide-phosphate guanylyltransferase
LIHYISGGARSGKSSYALQEAMKFERRGYLATAEAFDKEMESRISRHKQERGALFTTIEEPLNIADSIREYSDKVDVILVDCMTVWLNNLLYYRENISMELPEIQSFLSLLENPPTSLIIVSNELGMGIVPADSLSREYRDQAGFLNQAVAKRADKATFMVSGLPLKLK